MIKHFLFFFTYYSHKSTGNRFLLFTVYVLYPGTQGELFEQFFLYCNGSATVTAGLGILNVA
jgi:hypothetical protein